jgi:hypothetical protein
MGFRDCQLLQHVLGQSVPIIGKNFGALNLPLSFVPFIVFSVLLQPRFVFSEKRGSAPLANNLSIFRNED